MAARVAATRPPGRSGRQAGLEIQLGRLLDWDDEGPWVDYPGNPRGRMRARVASPSIEPVVTPRRSGKAAHAPVEREVVLLVDPQQRQPPVLLGYLAPAVPARRDESDIVARVDGRRIELDGRDEIVLRCGEASITLRRNGRIAIRGIDVETRAAGSNRIRGGTVDIN